VALGEEQARLAELKAGQDGERQVVIRRAMQATMTEQAGLFREEKALLKAVERIGELKERCRRVVLDNRAERFNYDLVDTLELAGMLELAEVTALMASQRAESRGSHARTDYPARNDGEWLKHSMADYNPLGRPRLWYKAVMVSRYPPMERKY
jgi:succinate dehydrogenase / fumarate reductase flavoprotein subunit